MPPRILSAVIPLSISKVLIVPSFSASRPSNTCSVPTNAWLKVVASSVARARMRCSGAYLCSATIMNRAGVASSGDVWNIVEIT